MAWSKRRWLDEIGGAITLAMVLTALYCLLWLVKNDPSFPSHPLSPRAAESESRHAE